MTQKNTSLTAVMGWMVVISVVLFWLPIASTLIGGYVGGKKAGGAKRGVKAALLPGLVVSIVAFIGFSIIGPIVGLVSPTAIGGGVAVALLVLYLVYSVPLVSGAVVGGALAN